MLQLGSVCLIREADNIVAVIDKTDLIFLAVTEFLDGADIESDAFSGTEFLPQMLSILYHRNSTEIQELLAIGKQLDYCSSSRSTIMTMVGEPICGMSPQRSESYRAKNAII